MPAQTEIGMYEGTKCMECNEEIKSNRKELA
jgi:hypothetical protein